MICIQRNHCIVTGIAGGWHYPKTEVAAAPFFHRAIATARDGATATAASDWTGHFPPPPRQPLSDGPLVEGCVCVRRHGSLKGVCLGSLVMLSLC